MTNRPARPLPQSPIPHDESPSSPRRCTSPFPGGAAPPCRRHSLNSTPRRRFTPRRRPPPARVPFIGGAAPRSRLSTPRSRTLAPAMRSHPPGAPGAAPSSQRDPLFPAPHPPPNGALPPSGAPPSSRRGFVLSRSGFLPQVAIRFAPPFLPLPIRVLAPPAAGCWPTLACPRIQRDTAQCSRRCSTRPIRPPIAVDPPQPAFGSGDSPLAQGSLLFLRLISRRPLNIMVAALEVFH